MKIDPQKHPNSRIFSIGEKVICVDDEFSSLFFEWGDHVPDLGEVYTIRAFRYSRNGITGRIQPSVLLDEIFNNLIPDRREVMFCAYRFRSIETRSVYLSFRASKSRKKEMYRSLSKD